MIRVVLPAFLNRPELAGDVVIDEPVQTLGELMLALDGRYPGLAAEIDDSIFNFAVNDRMVLHRVAQEPLTDGDTVEVIPTIAGG